MGIKTITTKDSIKIFGNPKLKVTKRIKISNFLKDHRVFMTSVIAGLTYGGNWKISDKDSINSSFPYAFSSSMGVQLATPFLSIKFISLQTYSHVRSALKVHDAFT